MFLENRYNQHSNCDYENINAHMSYSYLYE